MPLVVGLDYKFTCPPHAKVGLAFRYGLEVNENEVLAYFLDGIGVMPEKEGLASSYRLIT